MCGICGIVHSDQHALIPEDQIIAMRDVLTHRGPDDAGHYLAPGAALGSRRLAILDLSERGHMPMYTPDQRYWIVYNGEVYNFQELRQKLEGRGWHFRSNADTEVLLYLYAEMGPAMLDQLNGMFAIAVWDAQERRLFLARDHVGIKPLFYALHQEKLYFASEEKALFQAGVPLQFNHTIWAELMCFRYVAGEQTPFTGIQRLLPGHYLTFQDGRIETRRWWNLAQHAKEIRQDMPVDPVQWFRQTFDHSTDLRRISDVPVGVLLSGGLDSSSLSASLALAAGKNVASFTVRFSDMEYDEGPLARQVAERWHLDFHELFVPTEQILDKLQEAAWYSDEPFAHASDLFIMAISRFAKPIVTVLLSGEGADETLGGYVRYRPLRWPGLLTAGRPLLGLANQLLPIRRLKKLEHFLNLGNSNGMGTLEQFVLYNACDTLPQDLQMLAPALSSTHRQFTYRRQVIEEARQLYPHEPLRQAMYSDQHTFLCSVLDRNDRMTMAASIECRVPFLDRRLLEKLAAMPTAVLFNGFQGKALLRSSMKERLPGDVLKHPKWGFGVPWNRYLRQQSDLRATLLELPRHALLSDAPFEQNKLAAAIQQFLDGDDQHYALLLQLWLTMLTYDAVAGAVYARIH